jgi:hypothetical protein
LNENLCLEGANKLPAKQDKRAGSNSEYIQQSMYRYSSTAYQTQQASQYEPDSQQKHSEILCNFHVIHPFPATSAPICIIPVVSLYP